MRRSPLLSALAVLALPASALFAQSSRPTLDTLALDSAGRVAARHSQLARKAMSTDDYAGIFTHNQAFLAAARQASAASQTAIGRLVIRAYSDLAYAYGNKLHPDSALFLLKSAVAGFPSLADSLNAQLASDIARYELVGTPATTLGADYWVNASGTFPARGKVTLIEFGSRWCGYCRKSLPFLQAWHNELSAQGLDVVLSAQPDGDTAGKSIPAEEEAKVNEAYYAGQHKVTLPVAVEDTTMRLADKRAISPTWNRYQVRGIPQLVIVDRDGIIRQIIVGWDPESTTVMTPVLRELLAEKVARGK